VDNLALKNVAVTSTGTELNLVDGSSAGALASSKAVIYSSTDVVTGSAFVGYRAAATKVVGAAGTFVTLSGSAATVHTLAVGGTLAIDNDVVGQHALEIIADNTTANIFELSGSALTTGNAVKVYSNSSTTGVRSLVKVVNDNTSANKTTALEINQLSSSPAIITRGTRVNNHAAQSGVNVWLTGQVVSASYVAGGQYSALMRNSSQTDTTDTAVAIVALMGGAPNTADFTEFRYFNMGSNAVTLAGGTNVLMANMATASFAVPAASGRSFIVNCVSNHPDSLKIQLVPTTNAFTLLE
jgi:hypothetical protein